MSASTNVESARHGTRLPWGGILLSAIASVSWALIGMAGTAALGLHLLGADTASSLGPMTAAVVALGAGGSVTPSGDVSAFGLTGAEAATAIEITPLGVSLVGAVLLSWFFLRSLRSAGVVIAPAELLARAGAVVAVFVATLGGLAWAGHDVITIDGSSLGLDDLPGGGGGGGGIEIPGLGDVGDIGGLLPDQIGDLIDAKAAVGFTVDTAPTLLGGLGWSAGILLIALLASRHTPLPRGWDAVHRVVRPAASALVTVLLVAVAAGLAAAAYAAIGDDHPKRIAGAALLGAPNGVWLGIPIGLFVPFDGRATGVLAGLLPDPLDDLLNSGEDQSVTLGRLAELDGRVWLLGVAAAVMMLLAGVLTAVRTPVVHGGVRDPGALRFAGRCALRLGVATALALPLLAWLTEVSVDASLSVLGFDAFGAGVRLAGNLGMALVLGAAWGAGAGAVGAALARATGAAGQRATAAARGEVALGARPDAAGVTGGAGTAATAAEGAGAASYASGSGPYAPGTPYRPPNPATNPYLHVPDELREPEDARPPGADRPSGGAGAPGGARGADGRGEHDAERGRDARSRRDAWSGGDGRSGRDEARRPGDRQSGEPPRGAPRSGGPQAGSPQHGEPPRDAPQAGAPQAGQQPSDQPPAESPPPGGSDMYGAPTVARPIGPLPRPSRPSRRRGNRSSSGADEGPMPPPPPPPPAPPPPPGKPKGRS
ncbi:streptophobe family protein [Streptomyces sp. HD]|uniref:streptophobe family protein n=1 Tax=Streptomyces sp. HD TaxID=3020892 RepID=UPI00232B34CE|nr:streptophobe family protein [Streptomyces sp. HD]MDC0771834.1 streptophobe family protein [Streptomyces sp. HD]